MLDPAKLKVVELRAELSSRGLDTKGNKAALVDRLREALEKESGQKIEETSILDTSSEDVGSTSVDEAAHTKDAGPELKEDKHDDSEPEPDKSSAELKGVIKTEEETSEPSKSVETPTMKKEPEFQESNSNQPSAVHVKQEPVDIKTEADVKQEANQKPPEPEETTKEIKEEDNKDSEEARGEKRKHSPSPQRKTPPRKPDDEPEYDEKSVLLSWYDSDLHLVIDKETFTVASPMHEHGYGYLWAGVRASYGFSQGRVFFEVKLLDNCDVSHLEDEPNPHVLRVGWSCVLTSQQLGEDPKSYGYGGTGKASTDCKFKDYGKPFLTGDVVGAFLDLDSNPIIMSFTVNGEQQGVAYELSREDLNDEALFPHVLTKNIKFECKFTGDSWFPPLEGYHFVGEIPLEKRVSGPKRPEKRSDCEMIMMCGLPGCGKTTWANAWRDKHPGRYYNILGTNNLIDKMKVMGLPRKRNYAGRWDVLIDRCMKGLNKLLEIAARRRRNYILDQTNVYPSAQRRKMRGFEGFVRRAVVVVPTDEEFKRRIDMREKLEGKDVPDSAVLEMKANFVLPTVGDVFDTVEYTELPENEARSLVSQYNEEGKKAGYGLQNKRPRLDNRERGGGGGGFRGGGGSSGGFRQRGGSTSGRPDIKSRGGWQPRGGSSTGSRWDNRAQTTTPGFRRGAGAGGGSSGGWRGGSSSNSGGGRGSWDSYGSRGYDSRSRPNSGSGGRPNMGSSKGWGGGYSQGGGGGSGGGGWGGSNNSSSGGSGSWGQQGYNQQGGGWGSQQNYSQQGGWKGYSQPGGYGQGSGGGNYSQQSYNQPGYGNGNGLQNWNQQYYNQGGYQGSNQGWGQAGSDGSYSNYGQPQSQQQGSWQGYGQNYNYGSGSGQHMAQGGYGK